MSLHKNCTLPFTKAIGVVGAGTDYIWVELNKYLRDDEDFSEEIRAYWLDAQEMIPAGNLRRYYFTSDRYFIADTLCMR